VKSFPMPTTVDEWVTARRADVHLREFERSLISVGPDKPLGSMGVVHGDWRSLLRVFWFLAKVRLKGEHRGFGTAVFYTPTHNWVYRWHRDGLARVLNANVEVQRQAGWFNAETLGAAVDLTRSATYAPMTPVYVLVADMYGDRLNPGRPEILPGVPREDLLEAYLIAEGLPDPTSVFFDRQDHFEDMSEECVAVEGPPDPVTTAFSRQVFEE